MPSCRALSALDGTGEGPDACCALGGRFLRWVWGALY